MPQRMGAHAAAASATAAARAVGRIWIPNASSAARTTWLQSKSKDDANAPGAAPPWARMACRVSMAVERSWETSALSFLLSWVSKCGGEGHLVRSEGQCVGRGTELTDAITSITACSSSTTVAAFLLRKDGSFDF